MFTVKCDYHLTVEEHAPLFMPWLLFIKPLDNNCHICDKICISVWFRKITETTSEHSCCWFYDLWETEECLQPDQSWKIYFRQVLTHFPAVQQNPPLSQCIFLFYFHLFLIAVWWSWLKVCTSNHSEEKIIQLENLISERLCWTIENLLFVVTHTFMFPHKVSSSLGFLIHVRLLLWEAPNDLLKWNTSVICFNRHNELMFFFVS